MERIRKYIFIIVILIITVICLIWIFISKIYAVKGSFAEISVSGEKIYNIDLNSSQNLQIEGKNNIVLNIECKDGKIRVVSSECPDKICVNKGSISMINENIVCLPAQVIINISEED